MRSPRARTSRRGARPPRLTRRDEAATVAALYEQYASNIAAYALRRSTSTDAADVVAETFLVAWRRRDDIPDEPMTLPWLYGIARRVLANQRRAHQRRSRLHERLSGQANDFEMPTLHVENLESCERVGAALRKLSDADAEVLRLTAWEGLGPAEVAAVLDVEPDAIRQRLHRARKRLRRHLGIDTSRVRSGQHRASGRTSKLQPPVAALLWDLTE